MKKLRTLHTDVTINASKEKVWDALFTRFGEVHLYNPGIDSSHYIKGDSGNIGCERQCQLDAKTMVRERIVSAETNSKMTIDIFDGNMPMIDQMYADIELFEKNGRQTTVRITARYNTKPAFMGALMKGPMRSKFADVLIGLKYYLETGKKVSKEKYKPIKKAYKLLSPSQSFA
jgi:hypothetical protein